MKIEAKTEGKTEVKVSKKLVLNAETVKVLTEEQLGQVNGGSGSSWCTVYCYPSGSGTQYACCM